MVAAGFLGGGERERKNAMSLKTYSQNWNNVACDTFDWLKQLTRPT